MDASTFPHISSAARSVRSGRAPKEHRRKGGGGIDQPLGVWQLTYVLIIYNYLIMILFNFYCVISFAKARMSMPEKLPEVMMSSTLFR